MAVGSRPLPRGRGTSQDLRLGLPRGPRSPGLWSPGTTCLALQGRPRWGCSGVKRRSYKAESQPGGPDPAEEWLGGRSEVLGSLHPLTVPARRDADGLHRGRRAEVGGQPGQHRHAHRGQPGRPHHALPAGCGQQFLLQTQRCARGLKSRPAEWVVGAGTRGAEVSAGRGQE